MSEKNGVPVSASPADAGTPADAGIPADAGTPADAGETPEAVAGRLTGRAPMPNERADAAFYGGLRPALLAARDDAGLSQSELAQYLETGQSEVSRLETSVGPRTRLGPIRDYLAGCRARLAVVVSTATGRSYTIAAAEGDLAAPSHAPVDAWVAPAASPSLLYEKEAGERFILGRMAARAGTNVQGHAPDVSASAREAALIEHILALDEAMAAVGLPPDQATHLRHAFLTRLRPGQPARPAMTTAALGQGWPGDARATGPGQSAAEQALHPLAGG